MYALWTFAKAYVADKDRVAIDGGKGAEIKVRYSSFPSLPFPAAVI